MSEESCYDSTTEIKVDLSRSVQTGSESQQASYSMSTDSSFLGMGGKRPGHEADQPSRM
jgi:hypothetical protein